MGRFIGFLTAGLMVTGTCAATVLATAPHGFVGTTVGSGRFEEIDIKRHTIPADLWQMRLKTQGQSDLFVQSNVWSPGGSSGWHTHPGPSLIAITQGAVTVYESDDPTCSPHIYGPGMALGATFIDAGDDHVHIIRNETAAEARGVAVQLIPATAVRRIDAPHPLNCPVTIE